MFNFLKRKEFINIATKDEIAKLLKTNKQALEDFEESYKEILNVIPDTDNIFDYNAKQVASINKETDLPEDIIDKIVDELLQQTSIYNYNTSYKFTPNKLLGEPVSLSEINNLSQELKPQLTGSLIKKDIDVNSYEVILTNFIKFMNEKDENKKQMWYHLFRQGLDVLDLDPITYRVIGTNKNSMGYWLPKLVPVIEKQDFFKIPSTTVIKVPLTLLQLTRCDYSELTSTSLEIANRFCMKAFDLDVNKEYFIKTGTYSSKFDFRNARVCGEDEVKDIGEYLLFIHHQALQMASPLNNKSIYGVSTTNEWVVREFIKDKEDNPCIYKGMPLHTEYRVFIDFDTKEILGIVPYWEPNMMKNRFSNYEDSNSPHNKHDYVIYSMHEETLMDRYLKNKDKVISEISSIIKDIDLKGQWSIDIMQNKEDFYIIDMALACNSALKEYINNEIKTIEEINIPSLQSN